MKLCIYDHRGNTKQYLPLTGHPWLDKLPLEVLLRDVLPPGATYTTGRGGTADATHIIAHLSSTNIEDLRRSRGDWAESPARDQIVLCITARTGSLGEVQSNEPVVISAEARKRVILFARHEAFLAEGPVFRAFCEWQPEDAEEFVNGSRAGLPEPLRRLFQDDDSSLLPLRPIRDYLDELCVVLLEYLPPSRNDINTLRDKTHPMDARDIPYDFPAHDEFSRAGSEGLDGFRALYHVEREDDWHGCRKITVRLFRTLLERTDVGVKLAEPEAEKGAIKLPVQPGIIFIAFLIRFLEKLKCKEVELGVRPLAQGQAVTEVSVWAGLKDRGLEWAYSAGTDGDATTALRALLTCRTDEFLESFLEGKKEPWDLPKPPSCGRHPQPVLDMAFGPGESPSSYGIRLSWRFGD